MTYEVNSAGKSHASSLIGAGKINEGPWSFEAADGNKLLGDDDWAEYGRWFLAIDPSAEEKTKDRFHFPFGKDGEIYRRGVIAAKSRAAQNDYPSIEGAADALLRAIDKKLGKDGGDGEKKDKKRSAETDICVRRDMPALTAKTFDAKNREADAVISTGVAVRRATWDGEFDEVLEISPSAVRLGRLNSGAQLVDSHNWFGGLDNIVGAVVPGSARIANGKLLARFKFSNGAKGTRVARDLADGLPLLLSAGYKIHRFEEDSMTSPPTRNVKDWEPMEVSIVGVSAEGVGTGFRGKHDMKDEQEALRARIEEEELARRAKSETEIQDDDEDQKEEQQDETEDDEGKGAKKARAKPGSKDVSGGDSDEPMRKKGLPKPRERMKRTADAAADIVAIGRQAKMPLDEIETALREGTDVETFRTRAFEYLTHPDRDNGPRSSINGTTFDMPPGRDSPMPEPGMQPVSARGAAMVEALTTRILASGRQSRPTQEQMGWMERARSLGVVDEVEQARRVWQGHEQPKQQETRAWLGKSFVEIAAECIGWRGRELITQAKAGDIVTRAMMSTSDFPGIFANVLNKTLLARYQLAAPTYRDLAIERPFNDFRPHPQVRAGDFPLPQPLTEAGELRSGNSLDSTENVSVTPYGTIFNISRQMIVNDELGAIDQILGSAGMAVMVFENTTFFSMFNANPTLNQDTTAVFASGHSNLAGVGAVPSIATIGAARQAMRQQRSLSGYFLNIPPRVILTGPVQETVADQMVSAITPTLTTAVNPFSGRLRSVSDANIADTSWYLFAEAAQLPCFVYGFLAGFTGPRVRTEEPFGIQGIRVSLEHDFGTGAIDFRGVYKNPGA